MSDNQAAQSNPVTEADTAPGASIKAEFLKKIKMNKAKGSGPSKPRTFDYHSATAEFHKQDGTVYHTRWAIGEQFCDCPGQKYHKTTCKHIRALRDAVGMGNESVEAAGG